MEREEAQPGAAQPGAVRQQLAGHVTPEMARAPVVGRVAAETPMSITIGLPVRDKEALANDVAAVSDPASPMYGQYLTPAEFGAKYGPSQEDYQKVLDWAKARNLEVTAHANRLVVEVRGSAADVEAAIHVHLSLAERPDGSRFRLPDAEPSLDLGVPVEHIGNLDDYFRPVPAGGSGPAASYQGADFRNAYASCTSLTGTGQTIGILMLDGFRQSDVTAYFQRTSEGTPLAIQTVPPGTGTSPGIEGTLDVEMALSMAPGAQVVAFTGGLDAALANMASRTDVKQISSSWFTLVDATAQNLIAQMALQGQSFFQASGDSGGLPSNYAFSNSDFRLLPSVTNVGGTSLAMNGNGASYGTETAWNGSSGAILTGVAIPSYQVGLATSANGGSSTYRNMPDISAEATFVNVFYNGGTTQVGGTSAAAPLLAGFMALVNQEKAAAGKPSVGFANPAMYAIARTSAYSTTFNDITQGSTGLFTSTVGYDLTTGLGSPQCGLITALAGVAPPPPPPPACVAVTSCASVTGYAPPDITVTCPVGVDFFHQYPSGSRSFLETGLTMTESTNDYAQYAVACAHGTSSCSLYSEYVPTTGWCNQGSSSGSSSGGSSGGGGHCRGDNCCHGICQ